QTATTLSINLLGPIVSGNLSAADFTVIDGAGRKISVLSVTMNREAGALYDTLKLTFASAPGANYTVNYQGSALKTADGRPILNMPMTLGGNASANKTGTMLVGGQLSDTLIGSAFDDILDGYGGADMLRGG